MEFMYLVFRRTPGESYRRRLRSLLLLRISSANYLPCVLILSDWTDVVMLKLISRNHGEFKIFLSYTRSPFTGRRWITPPFDRQNTVVASVPTPRAEIATSGGKIHYSLLLLTQSPKRQFEEDV